MLLIPSYGSYKLRSKFPDNLEKKKTISIVFRLNPEKKEKQQTHICRDINGNEDVPRNLVE